MCERCEAAIVKRLDELCRWHEGERAVDPDATPGCQNGCGIYPTKGCADCAGEFLDWEARHFDDVMVGPYVTSSGDLYCTRCGREMEREDDADLFDLY